MAKITSSLRPIPEKKRTERVHHSGFFRRESLDNPPPDSNLAAAELRLFESFRGQPEETASRLASKLIFAALPAFYVMLCGPLKRIAQNQWEFQAPPHQLTDEQRGEVLQKLDLLADIVSFSAETFDSKSRRGQCRLLRDVASLHFPHGFGSRIEITKLLHDDLANSQASDPISVYMTNFAWAGIVLHELAHAAQNTTGINGPRVFLFPTAYTTEIGFEMERYVFGGLPRVIGTHRRPFYSVGKQETAFRGMLILEEYPSKGMVDMYQDLQPISSRLPLNDIERIWNLPLSYVVELHLEETWAELFADPNSRGLKYSLRTGIRRIRNRNGAEYVFPEAGEDLRTSKAVRPGFLLHADGLMYRYEEDLKSILPMPKVEASS